MKSFKEITESIQCLDEVLIILGKKAYPKFGNVVIMAGGAGSGKGFVKDNLLGVQGWDFDVDAIKSLAIASDMIAKKIKDELGFDMKTLRKKGALADPENVSKVHDIVGTHLKLDKKKIQAVYSSIMTADPERKPNLIFDVTLKDMQKLANISREVQKLGYEKDKIHIVWVINDVEVAKAQNLNPKRGRVVPAEILMNTHRGVQQTMGDIVNLGKDLKKYMDGAIVFAFNKIGVDSEYKTSKKGGAYIKKSNYFFIKKPGQQVMPLKSIDKDIKLKIKQYVPKGITWA
jgi:hypothetical protein